MMALKFDHLWPLFKAFTVVFRLCAFLVRFNNSILTTVVALDAVGSGGARVFTRGRGGLRMFLGRHIRFRRWNEACKMSDCLRFPSKYSALAPRIYFYPKWRNHKQDLLLGGTQNHSNNFLLRDDQVFIYRRETLPKIGRGKILFL